MTVDGDTSLGQQGTTTTTVVNGNLELPNIQQQGSGLSNYGNLIVHKTTGEVRYGSVTGAQLSSLRYKENVEIMTEEAAADLMKIVYLCL